MLSLLSSLGAITIRNDNGSDVLRAITIRAIRAYIWLKRELSDAITVPKSPKAITIRSDNVYSME
jgi:hypothetical protein